MEEVSVLIARSQQGDKEAREVLIEKNLGLVHAIVRRFLGRGVEQEDLFQIGTIGLIKAIDHFDLNYDVKFSTYAVPLISGEIKRFLRDDGPVKIPRTIKELGIKVNVARQKLQSTFGRDATIEEIAKESGLSVEEVVTAAEAEYRMDSIYDSVYRSDGKELMLMDTIGKEDKENEALLNHMLLQQLLQELTETESMLIKMRYFQDKTQVEVAGYLGISQVQVSRMEKKILLAMRAKIQEKVC
jgi:RNA polymerase sporulation-specific sigma factor